MFCYHLAFRISNFGIGFGTTILPKMYLIICITISCIGIKVSMKNSNVTPKFIFADRLLGTTASKNAEPLTNAIFPMNIDSNADISMLVPHTHITYNFAFVSFFISFFSFPKSMVISSCFPLFIK